MQSSKDFLRWYNNEDEAPTLDAKKKIRFYHSEGIVFVEIGLYPTKPGKYFLS